MTSLTPLFPSSFFTLHPSPTHKPHGKTGVITGGTRGLGLHAATGLMLAGCSRIIITSRKAAACEEARSALLKIAGEKGIEKDVEVFALATDLSKFSEVERFVGFVKGCVKGKGEEDGGVDILVANAGATWGESFDTHPDSAFAKVLDLNVRSVFNIIRLMTPLLMLAASPADPSRVITIGSIAGLEIGDMGSEGGTFGYSSSKAAVIHLTKHLAVELGPRNILCNCIAPGFFPSKMANVLIEMKGGVEQLGKESPNGRLGGPEDIAGVLVFLCSMAASHVNGVVIPLDGGRHLGKAAPRL